MNYLKQFIIVFRSLGIGNHNFNYDINDEFFDCFEFSEIKKGKLKVDVTLEKQERMLIFNFKINGFVNIVCDRCLEYYDQSISGEKILIVKFGDNLHEETDEILILPETETYINISKYIYEYISLLLPLKHIHPLNKDGESACNKDMIKKLEALTENKIIDSRWDALKKLKNNNNK